MLNHFRRGPNSKKPKFKYQVKSRCPQSLTEELVAQPARTKFAICTAFKNEAPYLDEWIRFHRHQGVDHFFLYNNFSADDFTTALAPHMDYVTVIDWPVSFKEGGQLRAMLHAVESTGESYRWLAIIDVDEFLFGVTQPLAEELKREPYSTVDQILVNTINYGSSSISHLPSGSLLKHLVHRAPLWWPRNSQRKCIVNPRAVDQITTIHEMNLSKQSLHANGAGSIVKPSHLRRHRRGFGRIRKIRRTLSNFVFQVPALVRLIPSTLMLLMTPYEGGNQTFFDGVSRIRINHYVVRSRESYEEKTHKYSGTQFESKYDESYFKYHDQNQVHDPVLADWDGKGLYVNGEGNR
jgi:hypothetical protein